MHPLSWKVMTWSLGLFAAVSFVPCVLYGLVAPKTLHMVLVFTPIHNLVARRCA